MKTIRNKSVSNILRIANEYVYCIMVQYVGNDRAYIAGIGSTFRSPYGHYIYSNTVSARYAKKAYERYLIGK